MQEKKKESSWRKQDLRIACKNFIYLNFYFLITYGVCQTKEYCFNLKVDMLSVILNK